MPASRGLVLASGQVLTSDRCDGMRTANLLSYFVFRVLCLLPDLCRGSRDLLPVVRPEAHHRRKTIDPSTAGGCSKPGHACPTSARQCPRPTPVTDTRWMARTPRIDMQLPQPEVNQRTVMTSDGRRTYNDMHPGTVALPDPLYLPRPSPRASVPNSRFPILVQAQRILGIDKPAPTPGSIREQPCGR